MFSLQTIGNSLFADCKKHRNKSQVISTNQDSQVSEKMISRQNGKFPNMVNAYFNQWNYDAKKHDKKHPKLR